MHSKTLIRTFAGSCAAVFLVAGASVVLEPRSYAASSDTESVTTPFVTEFESDETLVVPGEEPVGERAPAILHDPPIAYLKRVAGDPKIGPDELSSRIPVLMYHRIRPWSPQETSKERIYTVRPEVFLAQMAGLVEAGYHTITPADLERALREGSHVLPPKPVLLTFDDGFREHYTRVMPMLKRYGLQATFFIISQASKSPAHMTDEMVREADRSGYITIASHSRHHWMMAKLDAAALVNEVVGAKKDLEELLGHTVSVFAYPFGSYSAIVDRAVRDAGYTSAYGVRLGSLHVPSSLYNLRRIRVQDGEDIVQLLDAFSAKP